jgi:hypothetical protein
MGAMEVGAEESIGLNEDDHDGGFSVTNTWECSQCSAAFSNSANLIVHMAMHDD